MNLNLEFFISLQPQRWTSRIFVRNGTVITTFLLAERTVLLISLIRLELKGIHLIKDCRLIESVEALGRDLLLDVGKAFKASDETKMDLEDKVMNPFAGGLQIKEEIHGGCDVPLPRVILH
jgi:hypothetical protein